MIFDIGPFRLYRVEKNKTLDISLICMENWAFGWEWGWRDPSRGEDSPVIEFRIGKLMILYLNVWKDGCEIWCMGFWAFPSWGKEKK